MRPQRVAVAGIGGFAATHHSALRELESEKLIQVVATCDPRERELGDWKEQFDFAGRNVRIFDNFTAMLDAQEFDWIIIATPIALHASMHAACVERGLPCYLEKPPTLDPVELEKMIEVDSRATRETLVGFNYVYEPERLQLKERLLRGEFGALRQVSVRGGWRRSLAYYGRNNWAGKLRKDGTLLLDSCLGNAMAHYVHSALFFAGTERLDSWGMCRQIEAQLFRANAIEGADTVFLRGELNDSIEIRLALTHASESQSLMEEILVCEHAVIRLNRREKITIEFGDEKKEVVPIAPRNYLLENLRFFGEYASGASRRLLSNLIHCRPFVHLNAFAYLSTGKIHPIAPPTSEFVETENYWRIPGIENLLNQFITTGDFSALDILGAPTARPQSATSADLIRLQEAVFSLMSGRV